MKYYLLIIWGDVEIEKLGPYKSEGGRTRVARSLILKEKIGDQDGIHWLDIDENGDAEVGDYTSSFLRRP